MKSIFLTIKDVQKLKKNDERYFLCYDRNFHDLVVEKGSLAEVVKHCYKIKYTHGKELSGYITFIGDDEKSKKFEFHLNHMLDSWFSLNKGRIPNNFESLFKGVEGAMHIGKHYSSYPVTTKIGWRGPLIPLELVEKDVYIINDKV